MSVCVENENNDIILFYIQHKNNKKVAHFLVEFYYLCQVKSDKENK